MANHHIVRLGADVVIDDGIGAVIRLVNTLIGDLDGSDVLFR